MGVLGLVLPGVREIRTPLVVGWLWVGMLWLTAGLLPASSYDLPSHVTAPDWFTELGPAARVSILSVVAFFVGIAVRPLQELLIRMAKRLIPTVLIIAAGYALLAVSSLLIGLIEILFIVALVSIITALVIYHLTVQHLTPTVFSEFFGRFATAMSEFTEKRLAALQYRYRTFSIHDYWGIRRNVRLYIIEQVDAVAGRDKTSIQSFIRAADDRTLTMVAQRFIEAADPRLTIDYRNGRSKFEVSPEMLAGMAEHIGTDAQARRIIETFVVHELLLSKDSRRDLYLRFLDLEEWEEAIMREMDSLVTELQIQAPAVYQDWDRHTNEGEFRVSCSVPLALSALIIAGWTAQVNGFRWGIFGWNHRTIAERWSAIEKILSGAPVNFLIAGLALAAAIVVYRSGVASKARADDLMMRCLGRGVIKSASTHGPMDLTGLNWKSTRLHLSLTGETQPPQGVEMDVSTPKAKDHR